MSFFDDNLPILAAFAVAAPELFAADALAGETVAAGGAEAATSEAAAQEVARQEAARIAAEEAAKQAAAQQTTNQGIMQAGSTMTPQQAAYMDASSASANPGITSGTVPLNSGPAVPSSAYEGLQTNTNFVNAPPSTGALPQPGPVIDNGGLMEPPSALERGFDKFSAFADKHPYITAGLGYTALYNMGALDPRGQKFNADPYNGPLSKYRMSPDFQGRSVNPQNYQYAPRYAAGGIMAAGGGPVEQMSNNAAIGANTNYPMANMTTSAFATPYQDPKSTNMIAPAGGLAVDQMTGEMQPQGTRFAEGGITSYKSGGDVQHYMEMMEGDAGRQIAAMQTPAAGSHDVGIVRDADPDTMYLDPVSAAQVRMAKVNKRANMQGMGMKRPTPMGQLNLRPPGGKAEAGGSSLDPENAAQGGIMQASGHLGGYAAGGQPRLLKGPGDGMSDDIPATIADKQPARLADGEFVVPADVVSHLGNGSTDAGAKKLHGMMDNVRKARTGRKAQGKQINPNRFMPK
jgi:hypothetical protein